MLNLLKTLLYVKKFLTSNKNVKTCHLLTNQKEEKEIKLTDFLFDQELVGEKIFLQEED